jgi:hypothetical protein
LEVTFPSADKSGNSALARQIAIEHCRATGNQGLSTLAEKLKAAEYQNQHVIKHLINGRKHYMNCWALQLLDRVRTHFNCGMVTVNDWLTCANPIPLNATLSGCGTDRQWRQYGLACCEGLSQYATDAEFARSIGVAKLLLDGAMSYKDLSHYQKLADQYWYNTKQEERIEEAEAGFQYTPKSARADQRQLAAFALRTLISAKADFPDSEFLPQKALCDSCVLGIVELEARIRGMELGSRDPFDENSASLVSEALASESRRQAQLLTKIFADVLKEISDEWRWVRWDKTQERVCRIPLQAVTRLKSPRVIVS